MTKMTTSILRQEVMATGSHFFDHETMRFFGDTMRNFSCTRSAIMVKERDGTPRAVYVLWRKRSTEVSSSKRYYFDANTFHQVYPESD